MLQKILLGVVLPLVLVAAGLGLLFGLQAPAPATVKPPAYQVASLLEYLPITEVQQVYALSDKSDTLDIDINGTVVPYRELQLAAEAAGRIVAKDPLVRGGNYVKKGQELYRIDPRDYEFAIERLERQKNQEMASIAELDQDIENTRKLLKVAEDQTKLADREVARFKNMQSGFSSASELDTAQRAQLTSMNQEVTLKNQISTLETRRTRLEFAIQLVESQIGQAELDLSRTVIRSPVNGRIVSETIETDSYVQRGTQLVVIEDTEKVEVACNLRMDQLQWILDRPDTTSNDPLVNASQASRFELPKTPTDVVFRVGGREQASFRWQGVLDRYDGAGLDPQSRTIPIRIRVDNPSDFTNAKGDSVDDTGPPMLVRGMYVDVRVKTRPTKRLLLIPKLAIKPTSGSNVIWKFRPDAEAWKSTTKAEQAKASDEADKAAGDKDAAIVAAQSKAAADDEAAEAAENDADADAAPKIVPEEWAQGYLEIVSNVRMIASFGADDAYWVCEVPEAELSPGDLVIVTPLPGIKADGSDAVRYRIPAAGDGNEQAKSGNLANTNEGSGRS